MTEPKRARSDSVAYKADDEANDVTTERGGKTRDGRDDAYRGTGNPTGASALGVHRRRPKERPREAGGVWEGIAHPSAPSMSTSRHLRVALASNPTS